MTNIGTIQIKKNNKMKCEDIVTLKCVYILDIQFFNFISVM